MKPWKLSPADMVLIALFAVLIAVCAWISIPSAIPFTLQTFGLFAALGVLGGKRGTLTVLVYLLLGLMGIPVFSNFRAVWGCWRAYRRVSDRVYPRRTYLLANHPKKRSKDASDGSRSVGLLTGGLRIRHRMVHAVLRKSLWGDRAMGSAFDVCVPLRPARPSEAGNGSHADPNPSQAG